MKCVYDIFFFIYTQVKRHGFLYIYKNTQTRFHTDCHSAPFGLLKMEIVTSGWVQNRASNETGNSRPVTSIRERKEFLG